MKPNSSAVLGLAMLVGVLAAASARADCSGSVAASAVTVPISTNAAIDT